jgi:hypothetical protein
VRRQDLAALEHLAQRALDLASEQHAYGLA